MTQQNNQQFRAVLDKLNRLEKEHALLIAKVRLLERRVRSLRANG